MLSSLKSNKLYKNMEHTQYQMIEAVRKTDFCESSLII